MNKRATLILVFVTVHTFVCAQTTDQTFADTVVIEDIVVTHSKIPLKLSRTARPVQVIDRQKIERNYGKDLAQLLNEETGLTVNGAYSNPGKDKSVFLRGASGEYTVILIDGQPLLDPSGIGGVADIRTIALGQIERIEIMKGSQSSLYGSDAIAGVINIITTKSSPQDFGLSANAGYGSFGTFNGYVGSNGQSGILHYNASFSHSESDGISEALSLDPASQFEKDGSNLNSFKCNIGLALHDHINLRSFIQYADYQSDTDDGAFADANNIYQNNTLNTGAALKLTSENISANVNYNYTKTDRLFDSSFGLSEFFGRFHNVDSWLNYQFSERIQFTGGLHYQSHGMIDESATTPNPSDNILSPYITFLINPNSRLNAELGLRYNNHSKFGGNTNYSLAASYWASNQLKFFSNYSTGFKAPNLFQLYGAFGANENLDPQLSKSFELGAQVISNDSKFDTQFTYFKRKVNDVIVFEFTPGYFNRDKQNDQGVEVEIGVRLSERLSLKGQYTYLDGEVTTVNDNDQEEKSDNLYRRPKHNFTLSANVQLIDNLVINARLSSVGERGDLFFNPDNFFMAEEVILDSYLIINVYAQFQLSKNVILYLDLKNLTDSEFMEVYGFSTLGFNVIGGVRLKL